MMAATRRGNTSDVPPRRAAFMTSRHSRRVHRHTPFSSCVNSFEIGYDAKSVHVSKASDQTGDLCVGVLPHIISGAA